MNWTWPDRLSVMRALMATFYTIAGVVPWSPPTVFCRSSPIGRRCHASVLITGACELADSIALMTSVAPRRWLDASALCDLRFFPRQPQACIDASPSTGA